MSQQLTAGRDSARPRQDEDIVVMMLHLQHEDRRPEYTTPKDISLAYFELLFLRDCTHRSGSEGLLFAERNGRRQRRYICSYPRRGCPGPLWQVGVFLVSQALLILRVCFCLLPDVTCLPDTPYPDSLLELRLPWKRHRKVSCFG